MCCYFNTSKIENNKICNNSALTCGGGIYCMGGTSFISNNLIANNRLHAMRHDDCFFKLKNNTVVNNQGLAIYFVDCVFLESINDIFWGNLEGSFNPPYMVYEYDVQYSFIEDSTGTDPLFVNPTPGVGIDYNGLLADWSLSEESPAINAGIPDTTGLNIPGSDLYGNYRICNDTIDLGAIEYCEGTKVFEACRAKNIRVFPNPFHDYFYVDAPNLVKVELYDISSKLIISSNKPTVMTSDIKEGYYILKIYRKGLPCERIKLIKN